jgi:hypothetical protein
MTTAGQPTRRVDGSMSLLVDMMTNTLDESYADAARRRAGGGADSGNDGGSGGPEPTGLGRRAVAVLLLVALGVLAGTAAAQVRNR